MSSQSTHDATSDVNVLLFFVCGAIAGAAAALMFAPGPGRDTRAFLAQRGRRVKDLGRDMLNEHGERLSTAIERGHETALELSERIGHALEQGKTGYREAVRQGHTFASDATHNAEDVERVVRDTTYAADSAR